jgi:putative ABC transport system permease protein
MQTLARNFLHSLRSLAQSPGFTLAAVLTLALGIGANTAVFSVLDAVTLRPLPYRDPARLVVVWDQLRKLGLYQFQASLANYYEYRGRNQVFDDIGAFTFSDLNLEGEGDTAPERLEAMPVSANLLPLLGVRPALGQGFTTAQNEPGHSDAVLLSDGLWRRRFGADPRIVGRTLRMNGQQYRVQGVMPPGFAFTIRTVSAPDVWTPMTMPQTPTRREPPVRMVARLKLGVSMGQAQADLETIAAGVEAAYHPYTGPHGEDAGYGVTLIPLHEQLFGSFRTGLWILSGAVLFVLLIVCANVANLLLARGARRQREIALRAALGATRWQLAGELGVESLVLASAGGLLGTLLGWMGVRLLPRLSQLPVQTRIVMDLRMLAFVALLSLATGLIFGLVPALRLTRSEINLASGGRTVLGGGRNKCRNSLVAAEVALSVTLLAGAGLMLKSFVRLRGVDTGFDPRHVLTLRVTLVGADYRRAPVHRQFFDGLFASLRAIPGVQSVGFVNILPLEGAGRGGDPFSIEGRAYDSSGRVRQAAARYRTTPGYFAAMRFQLRSGRLLDDRDGPEAPRVAVVNETLSRGFWPRGDALGQHIMMGAPRPGVPWLTIVGIIADVRSAGPRVEPIPEIYTSFAQDSTNAGFVVLRTASDPMTVAPAVRRAISAADREEAGFDIRSMQDRLSGSIQQDRFQTLLLGIFALSALALAAIGIYGVLEHSVSQRIPEIGLRMALGAGRGDVLRMVVVQGMAPAIFGLALGLSAALALTRFLESLLFAVTPTDPGTFAAVPVIFAVIGLGACALPALKATRVDPITALRWE